MRNYIDSYTDDHPVAGCFGLLVAIALLLFVGPWIVMHAWTLIAVNMFGAPVMPYWTAFWGTCAAHIIFGKWSNKSDS